MRTVVLRSVTLCSVLAIACGGGSKNTSDGGNSRMDGGNAQTDGSNTSDGSAANSTFSLSVQPTAQAVAQGGSASVTVTVSRDTAMGDITLGVAGSDLLATTPAAGKIAWSFNPNPESGSGQSVLTFTVGTAVSPADYALRVQGQAGEETESAALTLHVTAPHDTLLVDDDGSSNNDGSDATLSVSDTLFRDLLTGAGVGYDVQVVPSDGNGPTAVQLGTYQRVIWYTGNRYGGDTGTLSSTDQLSLEAFLDQGARTLQLYSTELPYDVGAGWTDTHGNDFFANYLGAQGGVEDASDGQDGSLNHATFNVTGVVGTVTAGDSYKVQSDQPLQTYTSVIHPASGTDTLLTASADPDGSGTARAVACVTGKKNAGAKGSSKVVYVGITLENLFESDGTNANKQQLLSQLIGY